MNDCEFWSFLGNMREQSAAWHDWQHYYNKWAGWEKFRDKYLCLTDEKSDSVECKTMCKEACWREVFENADEDGLEASCPDGELSYPLTTQDILIYTLYRHEFHKGICFAFNIEHRESEMEDCCMTWRLGDFIPLAGMVFPAYISFPYDREELVETVKHLCLLHDKPFILMCPTREKLYLQAEQLLYSRKALYISLGEEIFFNQDGEINAHRKSEEIFTPLLEYRKSDKHENYFYRSGDFWEIRFHGGNKIFISKANTGAQYIRFLLERPHSGTPVTEITQKISDNTEVGELEELKNDVGKLDGFSIGPLPSMGAGPVADKKALRQYREDLRSLYREIDEAKASGDLAKNERLQEEKEKLEHAVNEAITPHGNNKKLNDSVRNIDNAFRNAVNRTIKKIKTYDKALYEHLKNSITCGLYPVYAPNVNIKWSFKEAD